MRGLVGDPLVIIIKMRRRPMRGERSLAFWPAVCGGMRSAFEVASRWPCTAQWKGGLGKGGCRLVAGTLEGSSPRIQTAFPCRMAWCPTTYSQSAGVVRRPPVPEVLRPARLDMQMASSPYCRQPVWRLNYSVVSRFRRRRDVLQIWSTSNLQRQVCVGAGKGREGLSSQLPHGCQPLTLRLFL